MTPEQARQLRELPSVEKIVSHAHLADLPRELAVRAARHLLEQARATLTHGTGTTWEEISLDDWAMRTRHAATESLQPQLRRAINATGILLHTNLGRAAMAESAAQAVYEVARGYATLEIDEESGGRGDRYRAVSALLTELTGAEDAFVVNNNAAATILAVAAIAAGREVIISRGQLVEIGGHFRLPDVIAQAGARLVEVGTTNRTRISDYERAITENTAMLLRVHPSNYRVVGFTEEASLDELVALGRKHGICVGDDIGSGALLDLSAYGLVDEPQIRDSVASGADVIWFSGDKLLGGPQCGILLGRTKWIAPMRHHPLTRALRPDKMTLAALESTLRLYAAGIAEQTVPTLFRIQRDVSDIAAVAVQLAETIRATFPSWTVETVETRAEVGGGSLPDRSLPSLAVALVPEDGDVLSLSRRLRALRLPVYGRIERGKLLLDLRAAAPDEVEAILDALLASLDESKVTQKP